MSTATAAVDPMTISVEAALRADLPAGAEPVDPRGLLARVVRPCPSHSHDARCVARSAEGRLLYWCGHGGGHHFSIH